MSKADSQGEDKAPLCDHLGDSRRFSSHRQTPSDCQSAYTFSSMRKEIKQGKKKAAENMEVCLGRYWLVGLTFGLPAFRKTKHYFRDTK